MIETEYGTLYCRHCDETHYYKATSLAKTLGEFKPVHCPAGHRGLAPLGTP
jgi:hypothetical protein